MVKKLYQTKHLGLGGRDACILAIMEEEKIKKLLTHDQSFKQIPNINVIDPIAKEKRELGKNSKFKGI
ncbi:MAG: hypothetical protein HZR80_00340 [Candidatus Heimdallarchaeota archaeon]